MNVGEEFPGPPPAPSAQDAFLKQACTKMADAHLSDVPLDASGLTVWYGTISPASWQAGSRRVSCGVGATMEGDGGWATLTGAVASDYLIDGQPPVAPTVAPEPEQSEQYQYPEEYQEPEQAPATSAPEVVEPTSTTPTPTTPMTTTTTTPETATRTSQAPQPAGPTPSPAPTSPETSSVPVEPPPRGPLPGP